MNALRSLIPVIMVFILFSVLPIVFSNFLYKNNIDQEVLLYANVLFLIITLISFAIQKRGLMNKNPHVFIRSVTGGMMIKMLFCILAVIAYVNFSGRSFNKRAIFISLFLYLIYLSAEVMVVMKMNKKQHA